MPMNINWNTISKLAQDNAGDLIKGGVSLYGARANANAQNKSADTNLAVTRVGQEMDAESAYQQAVNAQAQLDMQRRGADAQARDDAYRNAMMSALASNWKPMGRPDGVTSRNNLSMSPQMLEAAKMRQAQSMERLQNGEQFGPMEAPRRLDVGALYAQAAAAKQQEEKKKGGNIFGKLLKGAALGASFIPGVGQIASPILAGVGGLVNGDGLKSSLLNAGMSAIPFAAGKAMTAVKGAKTLGAVGQSVGKNAFSKVRF